MKYLGLIIVIFFSLNSLGQDIHSKYPCDTSLTYDILLSGATFSGMLLEKQIELQNLIYTLDNYKSISGSYFVKFIVNCDGTTNDIKNKFPGNTIYTKEVTDFITNIASENNWTPAIHRDKRVPHRKTISIEIKNGKIKELKI
tara:strand:- start:159 stop:587 length:429 start_codon:yes stop_codon:yes gene_type:complete